MAWSFYDNTGAVVSGLIGSWKFYDSSGVVLGGGGSGSGLSQMNVLKLISLRA